MKAAFDAGQYLWNGGDFYGTEEYNSLHLLAAYFDKYPEDADKVVISIKSGLTAQHTIDGSAAYVKSRVENSLRLLDGKKKIDIFEWARIPDNVDFWTETLPTLQKYVDEGKIGSIGLSEVSAKTIRRAAQITKISSVEVELSLWSTDILTNGVAEACGEFNIPITAYSPMGRGMLTGQIKSADDIPEGDFRRFVPRFLPENFDLNLKLVHRLEEVAKRQGCTPGQLSLAWVRQACKNLKVCPEVIPIPGASSEERILENAKVVKLDEQALKDIEKILGEVEIVGRRYPEHMALEG